MTYLSPIIVNRLLYVTLSMSCHRVLSESSHRDLFKSSYLDLPESYYRDMSIICDLVCVLLS